MSQTSTVDLSPTKQFVVTPEPRQELVAADVKRYSVIDVIDATNPSDQQVMDLLVVHGITLPISFNASDPSINIGLPGVICKSVKDKVDALTLSGSGEIAPDKLLERMHVCINELYLPPVLSAYLAGQESLDIDEIRRRYNPMGQHQPTAIIEVTGPSHSLKTTYLAIEAYQRGMAVVGYEPFSDWSFENMVQVLNRSNLSPESSVEELFTAIQSGMPEFIESAEKSPKDSQLSDVFDKLLVHFETGVVRSQMIFIDMPGFFTTGERPFQSHDLMLLATDAQLLLWTEHPDGTSRDKTPGIAQIIRDYRDQLERSSQKVFAQAHNNFHGWALKLNNLAKKL